MDFLFDLFFAGALGTRFDTQAERDVFKHCHMPKQGVMLEHKTNLSLAHVHMGGVFATEKNSATVSILKSCNDAKQRCLAAP